MPDALFDEPRLAALYDRLDPDRSDLDVYAAMVEEFGANSVLDLGCGTGTFACLLARRGIDVIGVDPARASLDVAQSKPGADRVRWVHGVAADAPRSAVDLVTMTANVAQVFVADSEWYSTLRAVRAVLRAGGRLVFETRDPAKRAWREWSRDRSLTRVAVSGVGPIEAWVDVIAVDGDLVSFRWTYVFGSDGAVFTSDSTLRFRSRTEVQRALAACGFVVDDVRDAPDRPGRELVFVARRSPDRSVPGSGRSGLEVPRLVRGRPPGRAALEPGQAPAVDRRVPTVLDQVVEARHTQPTESVRNGKSQAAVRAAWMLGRRPSGSAGCH